MSDSLEPVRAWQQTVTIPTYRVGAPERNPMFLDKRVYQGSSGKVYPWPVIDSVSDEKHDQEYDAVFLENAYLKIMVLPQLGGRIQMALDKTNDFHFVYYNRVIKPALVGLAGPWISGGIEFNWPQHHRPNTFGPVDTFIERDDDGAVTLWCHEIDRMYRTESRHGICLYPTRAFIEIKARLYNRTSQPQTFLWWANPAIAVDDNHQSIFPPDVTAVMDHGKRDVSKFPVADGTYYKVDYSPGTDISRYRNIPVPTSYMAYKSEYDFVGSYDHGRGAGLLHVCDHHISPGKKQWTWGNGEFGQAWDRHLTDEDGPYIELMCGVYTDNQPDFSWLMPGEEKSFSQYFMPYKGVGVIGNATIDAAVGMTTYGDRVEIRVYTTAEYPEATVQIERDGETVAEATWDATPHECFIQEFNTNNNLVSSPTIVIVRDADGRELVSWCVPSCDEHEDCPIEQRPEPAREIGLPISLGGTESLFLAGQHIEQYRHATRRAIDYYDEALSRDPNDIRCNHAKGKLLYRSGRFAEAVDYFQRAIVQMTRHNPNPYDGEPLYNLGLSLVRLERFGEAIDAFQKSTWNAATRSSACFELARLATRRDDEDAAIEFAQRCLNDNRGHAQANHLLAYLLREVEGQCDFAHEVLEENPFNFGVLYELAIAEAHYETYDARTRGDFNTAIELAIDYAAFGAHDRAAAVLQRVVSKSPAAPAMVHYHLANYLNQIGRPTAADQHRQQAQQCNEVVPFFANKLEDIAMLETAIAMNPSDHVAPYLLGNLWYDRGVHHQAIENWERSRACCETFPTVHRNLSLAYFNIRNDKGSAWRSMARAFELRTDDARVLFELDQLALRLGHEPSERLSRLNLHADLTLRRDDLYLQRITLHNLCDDHHAALGLLLTHNFHPWEGGEGKVPAQYVFALTQIAETALGQRQPAAAIEYLQRAKLWPHNLGEGKLIGNQENNINYLLGCAYEAIGDQEGMHAAFKAAAIGTSQPTSAMYYNDQPPEMIFYQGLALQKLGRDAEAEQRFQCLIAHGREHLHDEMTIDYFAVSLPDFLVFDADIDRDNQVHCLYMLALGQLGMGQISAALQSLTEVVRLQPAHQGARMHRSWLRQAQLSEAP